MTKAQLFLKFEALTLTEKKQSVQRNSEEETLHFPLLLLASLSLSLSLIVFLVFLRNKIFVHTHTGSIAKPTFSFNKVTSNRNSYRPPPQRT